MNEFVILLVEDEEDIREMVAVYLQNEGYRVVEAECGGAALELVEREHPDLVVLDVLLPDMSGIEVCEEIRKRFEMPIVFMSCKDESGDIISGLQVGGDDYVTKPFDPQVLMMRVKASLRRSRGMGGQTGKEHALRVRTELEFGTLTKREADILAMLARGFSNEDIAKQLSLSVGTVKWFNSQIFGKLNVKNRSQAIAKLHEMRLLQSK
jgi:DNA-binding NarL/FixJ family response regulator